MGVDISGLNPVIVSEKPESIDYDNATDEQKQAYWQAVDKWQDENSGVYFQSNWWGWRPIHGLCDIVSSKYKLRINTKGWGENSGYGLKNPQKCKELADALEDHINQNLKADLKDEDDRIYLCLGSWCTDGGTFLSSDIDQKLEEQYPFGTVLYNGVVLEDGTVAYPSHSSSLRHLKNWIAFLRNCGGFAIY